MIIMYKQPRQSSHNSQRLDSRLISILSLVTVFFVLSACGGGGSAITSSTLPPLILVSVSSAEDQGTSTSFSPSISRTGRYIAFVSAADNLVSGDTRSTDIFVRDVSAGTTEIVSLDINGNEPADGASWQSAISGDGRYVAFSSTSTALVPNDTNATYDIFVRDRQANTLTRLSIDSNGVEGNGSSQEPHISDDGRYIAYLSEASNLVADDTNGLTDIFIHNTQTNQTTRVSVDSLGGEGNSASVRVNMSADGAFVVFQSNASNLVADDFNGVGDVFVHNTQTGDTSRVSVDSNGVEGNDHSGNSINISADGRFIVFSSTASNLVDADANGVEDIFVHDTQAATTQRVSVSSNNVEANDDSRIPSISADGRYVAFASSASNLVDDDTNNADDIFIHDLQSSTTVRIVSTSSGEGDDDSTNPEISADGKQVSFQSLARNLVSDDSNMQQDVFRAAVE
jgi:hypothetical protein